MLQPIPYLAFDGNCAGAMRFYERALRDGSTTTMALAPTFWAKICGMLTDRFGTPWIVNGELLTVYPG